jgi:hypothetical protein
MLKRALIVALFTFSVNALFAPPQASAKPNHRGPCQHLSMEQTIRCAENLWPVAAGVDTVLYIAERESGLYPGAVSSSGTYMGIFQIGSYHMPSWPDGVMGEPWFHRWFPHLSWSDPSSLLNGRFSVFLGVRFMAAYGTGPWSM